MRAAGQATVEARRLRREIRRGHTGGLTDLDLDDDTILSLLIMLSGSAGGGAQLTVVRLLRLARSWSGSSASELLDAAAIWMSEDEKPF